jgi:hypothetical protein
MSAAFRVLCHASQFDQFIAHDTLRALVLSLHSEMTQTIAVRTLNFA